jgi:iron-sulfur cluster repair protein YtfE (RIC family)
MLRHPVLVPLSRDHHHALALCVRTDRVLASDPSGAASARAAAAIVQKFDAEILEHFDFEERVLFPLLDEFEALAPVVVELRGEHARMLELIGRLRAGGAQRLDIEEFTSMLRRHVHKEERVLFEQAQQLLPPDRLSAIGFEGSPASPVDGQSKMVL